MRMAATRVNSLAALRVDTKYHQRRREFCNSTMGKWQVYCLSISLYGYLIVDLAVLICGGTDWCGFFSFFLQQNELPPFVHFQLNSRPTLTRKERGGASNPENNEETNYVFAIQSQVSFLMFLNVYTKRSPRPPRASHPTVTQQHQSHFHPHLMRRLPLRRPRRRWLSMALRQERLVVIRGPTNTTTCLRTLHKIMAQTSARRGVRGG